MIALIMASGSIWPISGDRITRTRAGEGSGGLIGITDWSDYAQGPVLVGEKG